MTSIHIVRAAAVAALISLAIMSWALLSDSPAALTALSAGAAVAVASLILYAWAMVRGAADYERNRST